MPSAAVSGFVARYRRVRVQQVDARYEGTGSFRSLGRRRRHSLCWSGRTDMWRGLEIQRSWGSPRR